MKSTVLAMTVMAVALSNGATRGQPPLKLTPEQQRLLDKQRDDAAAAKPTDGELSVAGLKVGAKGFPTHIDAKVMQVIDKNSMLVGIEDDRNGDGKYRVWVLVKAPTTGIVDGEGWRGGQWGDTVGAGELSVTGTTTYKTVGGGTKTVFVLEVVKPVAAPKPANPMQPAPPAKPVKFGAAAYDTFPEGERAQLVKDWEVELEALKRAIKDDEERLARSTTTKDKQHFTRLIAEYKGKLARHEVNDPPYIQKK